MPLASRKAVTDLINPRISPLQELDRGFHKDISDDIVCRLYGQVRKGDMQFGRGGSRQRGTEFEV